MSGPSPLVERLRAAAAGVPDLFFTPGTFDEERFAYVGRVEVGAVSWHVVYLRTVWGEACRATTRLLVFDGDLAYRGQYSHFVADPPRADGDALRFDLPVADGNVIRFDAGGPPRTVVVGGQLLELDDSAE